MLIAKRNMKKKKKNKNKASIRDYVHKMAVPSVKKKKILLTFVKYLLTFIIRENVGDSTPGQWNGVSILVKLKSEANMNICDEIGDR